MTKFWEESADEKLVNILRFKGRMPSKETGGSDGKLMVLDCRPIASALGNKLKGKGDENVSHYGENVTLEYCGIKRVQPMQDAYDAIIETLKQCFVREVRGYLESQFVEHAKAAIYTHVRNRVCLDTGCAVILMDTVHVDDPDGVINIVGFDGSSQPTEGQGRAPLVLVDHKGNTFYYSIPEAYQMSGLTDQLLGIVPLLRLGFRFICNS